MKHFTLAILLCLVGLLVPDVLLAQTTFGNPIIFGSVQGLVTAFVRALIVMLIPVVVFFIIYAGFLYVTGRGNPQSITKASQALLYAVIGGVVILGSFAILSIVENTVNQFKTKAVAEMVINIV